MSDRWREEAVVCFSGISFIRLVLCGRSKVTIWNVSTKSRIESILYSSLVDMCIHSGERERTRWISGRQLNILRWAMWSLCYLSPHFGHLTFVFLVLLLSFYSLHRSGVHKYLLLPRDTGEIIEVVPLFTSGVFPSQGVSCPCLYCSQI